MKRLLQISAAVGIFTALLIFPQEAAESVKAALKMCAEVIIPSLFPFFAATNLINELGASKIFANALAPLGSRLLGLSGYAVTAFIPARRVVYSGAAKTRADKQRGSVKAARFLQ